LQKAPVFRTGTPKKNNFEAQLACCVGFIISINFSAEIRKNILKRELLVGNDLSEQTPSLTYLQKALPRMKDNLTLN
jgi:hypothetical protein